MISIVTSEIKPEDTVQVVMSEEMARRFEARCLGRGNTVGETRLSPPIKFEGDLPTYIIEVPPEVGECS